MESAITIIPSAVIIVVTSIAINTVTKLIVIISTEITITIIAVITVGMNIEMMSPLSQITNTIVTLIMIILEMPIPHSPIHWDCSFENRHHRSSSSMLALAWVSSILS